MILQQVTKYEYSLDDVVWLECILCSTRGSSKYQKIS